MTRTYELRVDDGRHVRVVDITDVLARLSKTLGAFEDAVGERMAETGEDEEDAIEALTANYTRAECEEAGAEAAGVFLTEIGYQA